MAEETLNTNEAEVPTNIVETDPHGQAAMLLVESLIHVLIERAIISVEDALEIVCVAAEVRQLVVADAGSSAKEIDKPLVLIELIGASLRHDLPPHDPA